MKFGSQVFAHFPFDGFEETRDVPCGPGLPGRLGWVAARVGASFLALGCSSLDARRLERALLSASERCFWVCVCAVRGDTGIGDFDAFCALCALCVGDQKDAAVTLRVRFVYFDVVSVLAEGPQRLLKSNVLRPSPTRRLRCRANCARSARTAGMCA